MRYEILINKPASAERNMHCDALLLGSLSADPRCIVHFYEWEQPSATYGYFIDPKRYFNPDARLQIARRPTGGGILFHTCDLTFSVLIPASHPRFSLNPLDSYAWINQTVLEALSMPTLCLLPTEPALKGGVTDAFCMAKPTRYDLMWEGRKIGGAAERRMKQGLLHQGTIALGLPDPLFLREVLQDGEGVAEEMERQSYALLGPSFTSQQLDEAREQLRFSLMKELKKKMQ